MLLGRVVFAVSVVLGFLALLASNLRLPTWHHLMQQVRSKIGVLILATIGLWAISALGSDFPIRSLEAVLRSGVFIAIGTMLYAGLRIEPGLQKLCLRVFVGVSSVCLVIAILESTFLPELHWALRLKGWVAHPLNATLKGFSSLAVMMLPMLACAAWKEDGYWRYAAFFTSIAIAFLVWDTSNRAVIAGFLAVAIVLTSTMFIGYGRRKHVLVSALCTIALVIGALILLKVSRGHFVELVPTADGMFPVWLIDYQRQMIWAHALGIADQALWLGIGANSINFTPGADAVLPGTHGLHIIPAHPHNWVVEILAETGLLGLSALVLTIFWVSFYLLRLFRTTHHMGFLVAIAIMTGYWVSGLFNFSYWSAWWQVSFIVAMAIALAGITSSAGQTLPRAENSSSAVNVVNR